MPPIFCSLRHSLSVINKEIEERKGRERKGRHCGKGVSLASGHSGHAAGSRIAAETAAGMSLFHCSARRNEDYRGERRGAWNRCLCRFLPLSISTLGSGLYEGYLIVAKMSAWRVPPMGSMVGESQWTWPGNYSWITSRYQIVGELMGGSEASSHRSSSMLPAVLEPPWWWSTLCPLSFFRPLRSTGEDTCPSIIAWAEA